MANISLPSSLRIKHIDWALDRPAQINRSAYTGTRAVVANPWHGMWRAKVQLAAEQNTTNILAWKSFLAQLKGQINTFQLPATESSQHSLGNPTVSGSAAQGATSLTLTTAPTLGPELLTNGDFSGATTTGWTPTSATLSVVGGKMRVTATSASVPNAAQTISSLVNGHSYRFSDTQQPGTTADKARTVLSGSGPPSTSLFYATNGGSPSTDFTAGGTGFTVSCQVANNAAYGVASDYSDFDNVSLKEILSTGVTPLTAGMLVAITLPSGNSQLVMLTRDISGASVITFEPPLREAVSGGAQVETVLPTCQVSLASSDFTWSVDPGTLYSFAFDVEEAF